MPPARLRGPLPSSAPPERKAFTVYALPRTHLLLRLLAENRGAPIGRVLDELIASEADAAGISLGKAS